MTYPGQHPYYLLVVSEAEDIRKLDSAVQQSEINLKKLGDKVYLAEYAASPEQVYKTLAEKFHVTGAIQWVPLSNGVVTDNK